MIRLAVIPGGSPFSRVVSLAFTASATATVFVPDCFTTSNETAGSPLARMRVRSSSKPSSTCATSESFTLDPSAEVATIMFRICSTVFSSPTVRTLISRVPSSKCPAGTVRFCSFSRCRIASGDRLSASIRARSRFTCTSRSAPPFTSTLATPSTCSSAGFSTSRANFAVSASDFPPPLSVYVSTGVAPTSRREIAGSFTSSGSFERVCATRSRTCVAASWMSTPSLKKTIVVESPSRDCVRRRSIPLRETTASSIGLLTSCSTSEGEAPGYGTFTTTTGKETSGKRSVPRRDSPRNPNTMSATVTMTAKTGRLIAMARDS